ncbi:MAG: hypothetical protein ABSH46_16850 [Bryobacteraceae bacterium]|jgi:hypothetical protein
MARLEDESLVLSCPACGAFAQVRSGDADTVCWQCRAHLLVRLSGGQVKLVVAPPAAEPAPEPEPTGGGPPPLPVQAEQAAWPAGAIPNRRASGFPAIAWVIVAIMVAGAAIMFLQRLAVPDSFSVLRSPDGRIELELPLGWGKGLIGAGLCQISATNRFDGSAVCVVSYQKERFRDLPTFNAIMKKAVLSNLEGSQASGDEIIQLNGRPALRYEMTVTGGLGIGMGYVVTNVETETLFIQVVATTIGSRFPETKARLAAVANGLREVAPASR